MTTAGAARGLGGCGKAYGRMSTRRTGERVGFKKNEITDWVAANWPASNQSLVAWMREYIMYTIHRAPWNRVPMRPIQNHVCARVPVCVFLETQGEETHRR